MCFELFRWFLSVKSHTNTFTYVCPCLRKCEKGKTKNMKTYFGRNLQQKYLFSHVQIYFFLLPKPLYFRKRQGRSPSSRSDFHARCGKSLKTQGEILKNNCIVKKRPEHSAVLLEMAGVWTPERCFSSFDMFLQLQGLKSVQGGDIIM